MNVKIIRVLNTNAVVSVDSQGMELIMTGPGIGFKKRKGENIDQSLVDKTYHLENKEESKRLQEVVKEISEEYLGIVDRVVKEAKKEKLEIRDSLYVTLTDHINSAVARYREGIALKNMMKIDIRKFYPKEYQVGMHAIEWIKEQTGEDLGDDEAAFIAMHIVSAELNAQNITDVNQITELINTVLQIVRIHFKIDLNEESISYERFLTHLKFFAHRLITKSSYQDEQSDDLLELIKIKYKNAYACCLKIKQFLKTNYAYDLSQEETLYLTIHIARVVYKNERS